MKRFLVLFILVNYVSCNPMGERNTSKSQGKYDSIQVFYDRSFDQVLSLKEKEENIDRALHLASFFKDTIFDGLLYQKSSLLFQRGKYDSLLLHHKEFIKNEKEINTPQLKASQYYLMGYYYDRITFNYNKSFENYGIAKNYFETVKDSSWVGRCLLYMGVIQKNQNDFFGSKETVTEALQFLREPGDKNEITQCYNLLATNHRKLLNYSEAVEYFKKALEGTGSRKEKRAYENNLAVTLIDYGEYEEAVSMLRKIMADTSLDKTSTQYSRVLDNLAYAQWVLGKEKVKTLFLEALKIRKENKDERGLIASYTHLGQFYSKDRPQVAKAYFDTVVELSKSIKMPRAETDALSFLMQLEPNNVQLRDRYIFLKDSLYAEELKVKTQFAKYKYDNRVAQEKGLRLEKENAEQDLEVSRQRNQKIISFFGLALLLILMVFGVYYFKQRTRRLAQENRTAKLEATLETEAEMSRRLHDDFGAGLNQAMLMVQGDMDKSKILDNLDGLYQQSRNFSREINEVDTGQHFKEELLEMLRYRTPENAKLLISGSRKLDWDGMAPISKKVLYKALQELMINMERHSKANLITIGFGEKDKMLGVDYADNGVGATEQELKGKNGLRNTEKRIQAIGGTITFDSDKGEGFRVHIEIPT